MDAIPWRDSYAILVLVQKGLGSGNVVLDMLMTMSLYLRRMNLRAAGLAGYLCGSGWRRFSSTRRRTPSVGLQTTSERETCSCQDIFTDCIGASLLCFLLLL